MSKTIKWLALAALIAPGFAWSCSMPEKPELPDPATAVSAQMIKAQNDVKTYVKAVQDYIGCARLPTSKERQTIDELRDFAENFNKMVRDYKAKSAE